MEQTIEKRLARQKDRNAGQGGRVTPSWAESLRARGARRRHSEAQIIAVEARPST